MTTFAWRLPPSGPILTGTPGYTVVVAADGRSFELVPSGSVGGVTSWNLRTGAVVPVAGDYFASEVTDDSSVTHGAGSVADALDILLADTTISGTPQIGFVVGWDGTQKVWEAVPTAFHVTSFALTGASLVLVGATVATPAFTATYNQPATVVTLTDTDGHSDGITLPGTAFSSPHSFTKTVYGQTVTFTDTASSPLGSSAASATLSWGELVYFGSAVDPGGGGYNAAFITSLGSVLKLAPAGSYAYNASALQSCLFAARSAFGLTTANFTVNGFPFACSVVAAAVAITNANGIVENFDLFRSDNIGLGSFNLVEA